MQRSHGGFPGKVTDTVTRRVGFPGRSLAAGVLAVPAVWLLTGCSSGEDLLTTVALPPEQTVAIMPGEGAPLPLEGAMQSGKLEVTPVQQAYLDALGTAGVHPSSELRALSIGSSICQARAAGQSPQAVWDYVAPMVRSDVADAGARSPKTTAEVKLDAVTADYIRIATQRLC